MIAKLLLVALCIGIPYTFADKVNTTPCLADETKSENVEMEVTGCTEEQERCELVKGRNYTVKFYLTPTQDFTGYTQFKVYGIFKDFTVQHGRTANACATASVEGSTDDCTSLGGFLQGQRYVHVSQFGVSSKYPSLSLRVKFMMLDRRSKEKMLCQEIAVQIVEPEGTTTEAQ